VKAKYFSQNFSPHPLKKLLCAPLLVYSHKNMTVSLGMRTHLNEENMRCIQMTNVLLLLAISNEQQEMRIRAKYRFHVGTPVVWHEKDF